MVCGAHSITLTVGVDTVTGTSGNDTINVLNINPSTGEPATTLNAFDVLNGGAGTDTVNIYVSEGENETQQGTFSNIEIVNIYNDGVTFGGASVDASKFVGATQVWQIGAETDVTDLAATTTAGFRNIEAAAVELNVEAAAATATVALDDVTDTTDDVTVLNITGDAVNTVVVSGSLTDSNDADDTTPSLALDVTVGEDETTLTVNTAIDATLTFDDAGSTDKVNTINAAASAGGISFAGNDEVVSLTTGAGEDTVTLSTVATDDGVAASVTTGEGDDVITVEVVGTGFDDVTTTVSAGAGDDEIEIDTADTALSVDAGAGDDTVTLTLGLANVATTDVIGGGAGTDTVVVAGATLVAEDYILLTEVVTAFEAIEFTGATAAVIDASRMSNYKDITFAAIAANAATEVAADQTLTLRADNADAALTASAVDYDDEAVGGTVYGGNLVINVAGDAADAIAADVATVTVNGSNANITATAGGADLTTTVNGDVETLTVTVTNSLDDADEPTDMFESAVEISTDSALAALTTLTLAGNGNATVTNAAGSKLATVDASDLASTTWDGVEDVAVAGSGLNYTTTNDEVAETISLGNGKDVLTFDFGSAFASTFAKMDTVNGLNLVADGDVLDTELSDAIIVFNIDGVDVGVDPDQIEFSVLEDITGSSLNTALVNVAASAEDFVVFAYGNSTYIYGDIADADTAATNTVSDNDLLIKITGSVDVDLLVAALNDGIV